MKKHILIADDEKHALLSMSLILKSSGYKVSTADNGKDALQKLSEKDSDPVDLLLTDIKMPDIDGLELLNIMNKNDMTIPTVAITGFGNKDVVIRLMRYGCRDYLEKPFTAKELLTCLENVFRSCEAEQIRQSENSDRQSKLSLEIETYKLSLERLRTQLESAVNVYHELIDVSSENYPLPIAWKNRPLMELGGDFIGIEKNSGIYDILVADVAGHDMGSSLHTILIKAFFQENAHKGNDGSTLFHLMNRQLLESGKNERMITAAFLRINLNRMTADLLTAGHPPAIYMKKSSDLPLRISTGSPVLGISENGEYHSERIAVESEDRLFIYTDGVTGAMSLDPDTGYFEKLSADGLEKLIRKYRNETLSDAVSNIWDEILTFCDDKPCDDMLLLGVEIP